MRAFGERNLVAVAAVGITAAAAVIVASYYADSLPLIGGGTRYSAQFGDAANLTPGDDVRVAGVKVGKVKTIALSGQHVDVAFTVKDAWVGDRSTVAIAIKTTLGQEYLALDPQGTAKQKPGRQIPLSRTTTPYDVTQALSGLASTSGQINTGQLATAFTALADAFADTPPAVRSALTGLTRLSQTISQRDDRIAALAQQADRITKTLADSNAQFTRLINDGAALLSSLQARSDSITQLLTGTRDLSRQLAGFVRDNQKLLGPALTQLDRVTTILTNNRTNLSEALRLIGPYYTLVNDAAGNGPWIDIYICGLFDTTGAPVLSATVQRNCTPKSGS